MEQYQELLRTRFKDETFDYRAQAFRRFIQTPRRSYKESPTTKEYVDITEEDLEKLITVSDVPEYSDTIRPKYDVDCFFVNDQLVMNRSNAIIESLNDALRDYPEMMERQVLHEFGRDRIEYLINSAFNNGYFLYVKDGTKQSLRIESAYDSSMSAVSKMIIVVGDDASLTLTDIYQSVGSGSSVQGRNVYIFLGKRSSVQYNYIQEKSHDVTDICFVRSFLDEYSQFKIFHLDAGGSKVLFYNESEMRGEGSDFRTFGSTFSNGDQRMDIRDSSFQTGVACNADIQVRGVVRGRSSTLHRGNIDIEETSIKSTGFYDSKILLLSKDGFANSKPGLIILNSDTKSKHGSAISNVDPEQILYLRSRGINEVTARNMITEGFTLGIAEKSADPLMIERSNYYSKLP